MVEAWTSTDLSPTEEELQWLTEGGGGWPRSGDFPPPSAIRPPDLGRPNPNLTWRFRVAEARERERIEQELQVSRRIQQASLPKEVPTLEGWEILPTTSQLGRWEETSTISLNLRTAGWD